jgi:hypothetical protein
MNILEALQAVKEGKIVKLWDDATDTWFYMLQTTLHPFMTKTIVSIDSDDFKNLEIAPQTLEDIPYDEISQIEMDYVSSNDFMECDVEGLLARAKTAWDEENLIT